MRFFSEDEVRKECNSMPQRVIAFFLRELLISEIK
jgi:hypothetical protein